MVFYISGMFGSHSTLILQFLEQTPRLTGCILPTSTCNIEGELAARFVFCVDL